MPTRSLSVLLLSCAVASANPGKAGAVWVSSSATVEPGKPLQTAIRLTHDKGWHSYWINPGEAGIPTTVEWKLPPGWKSGGLHFPAPIRFLSGGLAGYGYEETTWLPVTITAPEDFTGKARLSATISWLACSEDGCVPGEAELQLDLRAGKTAATEDRAAIFRAHLQLPQPREGVRLDVKEEKERLMLTITHDAEFAADLSSSRVFPATPDVIDPQAEPRFKKEGGRWIATAPLGEFAEKPLRNLVLVLDGGGLETPLLLTWSMP
jgi:DsbC/DsbD-like thiol-disulfide interchange protein